MATLLSYFIKVSALLALVYLFYALALRRNTFYSVNRFYFLTGIGASFILPALSLPLVATTNPLIQQAAYPISEWDMDVLGQWLQSDFSPAHILFSATDLILWIMGLGVLLFLFHFCVKLYSFFQLKTKAQSQTVGETKIFWVREALKPFSFWGNIFLNPALHSELEIAKIVAHEIYHIEQRHTLDLLLGEALVIISWFNPFVWLLRKAIRQNLEYLADRHILNSGCDILQYQYALVRTGMSGMPGLFIAHNFTFSNLKKRIIMMNKKPSTPFALCKYLLILPLFGFAWIGVHGGEIAQTLNEIVLIQQELPLEASKITSALPEITPDIPEITHKILEITTNLPETPHYVPAIPLQDTLKKGAATPKATVTVISNNDTIKVTSGRLMLNGAYISREDLEQNYPNLAAMIGEDGKLRAWGPDTLSFNRPNRIQQISEGNNVIKVTHSKELIDIIFVLNGDTISKSQFAALNPAQIKDIRVGGGQVIATHKSDFQDSVKPSRDDLTHAGSNELTAKNLMFILNDKVISIEETDRIDPNTINSISVLKDQNAIRLYGPDAANGVVIITTKDLYQ